MIMRLFMLVLIWFNVIAAGFGVSQQYYGVATLNALVAVILALRLFKKEE